jgi:hypothetical protein
VSGYQLMAVFVGIVGFMFMGTAGSERDSLKMTITAWVWLIVWCLPPLVTLWIKSAFS